ncbi:MAG: gliding motility-associated C-terminal domain-containing protein, partial [Flavobacteriia bacterium]|nr:gliding motility-associated C-terminal domain-containing protein [Flavobacteriia bacterium]
MKNTLTYLFFLLFTALVMGQEINSSALYVGSAGSFYLKAETVLNANGLVLSPAESMTLSNTKIIVRRPAEPLTGYAMLGKGYSFSSPIVNYKGGVKIKYAAGDVLELLQSKLELLAYTETALSASYSDTTHDLDDFFLSKTISESVSFEELSLGYAASGLPSLGTSSISLSANELIINSRDSVQITLRVLDVLGNPIDPDDYAITLALISGLTPSDPGLTHVGGGVFRAFISGATALGASVIGFRIDGNLSENSVRLRYVNAPEPEPEETEDVEQTDETETGGGGTSAGGGGVVVAPKEPEPPLDTDSDGMPDTEDPDDDGDGQTDVDELSCGTDPLDATSFSGDIDQDGIADCFDNDNDNDGVANPADAFPLDPTEWTDTDRDGLGNNKDTDDDGDGWSDLEELTCGSNPLNRFNTPSDQDKDGVADCLDSDRDGDGFDNTLDLFPDDGSEWEDTDGDGLGDNFEVDDDNDGCLDINDAFPKDISECLDSDGDGIGDNADLDDNNDGYGDEELYISGLLTPNCGCSENVWRIVNIEQFPLSRVSVFNKNGQEVFTTQGYQNNWSGTYKGK